MSRFHVYRSMRLLFVFGLLGGVLPGIAIAAQDGPYFSINANVAYGPSTISVHDTAFGEGISYSNGYPKALFSLANDGRFAYTAAAGYSYKRFGVELRYIDLGSQHLIGVNGNPLGLWENGSFGGNFIGINAFYSVPINNGKQDLFFSVGEGNLRTKFTTTQTEPWEFSSTGTMHAPQNEAALLLGGGLKFNLSPRTAINLELDSITPNSHGHVNSGIYNVSFIVFSAGFTFTMP